MSTRAKIKVIHSGCTLADVTRMVKSAMQYIDGSASVSFQIDSAGTVTAFRLVNNFDEPQIERERGHEDDEGGRGGFPR